MKGSYDSSSDPVILISSNAYSNTETKERLRNSLNNLSMFGNNCQLSIYVIKLKL